jgi:hypothetical protein
MTKSEVNIKDLKPVTRMNRFVLEENELYEVQVWKVHLTEKFYQGESQGDFPTFELLEKGSKETVMLQSRSASSYAMLDDWDDRKAPCNCYVWKNTEGSRTEIQWAYKD